MPGSDVQTFEVFLPRELRIAYDRLLYSTPRQQVRIMIDIPYHLELSTLAPSAIIRSGAIPGNLHSNSYVKVVLGILRWTIQKSIVLCNNNK